MLASGPVVSRIAAFPVCPMYRNVSVWALDIFSVLAVMYQEFR